jgi:drug/metabolite transporter (DMT)-like permease
MNEYLTGILAAFFDPILHAWANVLDSYFSNKLFERLTPLIFFSTIIELCVLPIIWIISPPSFISLNVAAIIFAISLIEVLYLYPYYWSLRHTDTSVVASLFSLGRIFVPLFAFFVVGERLSGWQYLGFFILIAASVLLALDIRKMKLNRAFFLMFTVSAVLAIQSVLLKYVYDQGIGWGTSIIWMTIFQFVIAAGYMLVPRNFAEMKSAVPKIKSNFGLFVGMELLSWGGNLGGYYALYLIPVSIVNGIFSIQPVFVLLYAVIFAKLWPNIFKEYLGKEDIVKKVVLFALTIVGIILIANV